jgi:hypothetical protein
MAALSHPDGDCMGITLAVLLDNPDLQNRGVRSILPKRNLDLGGSIA